MTLGLDLQRRFGELLDWHLNHGTRPEGRGVPWTNQRFAGAIKITINERSVRNWRRGKNIPIILDHIERSLFGANQTAQFVKWREELRTAHADAKRAVYGRRSQESVSEKSYREIIDVFLLRFPQDALAEALVAVLGFPTPARGFKFTEAAGDIIPENSYIILENNVRFHFRFQDIDAAHDYLLQRYAKKLIDNGMQDTCWSVDGSSTVPNPTYAGSEIPKDKDIMCLLEGLTVDIAMTSSDELAEGISRYATNLPEDMERSHLNALPTPSPSSKILNELIRREAWSELHTHLGDVLYPGVVILWCVEIIKLRALIKNKKILALIKRTHPSDERHVRPWAEAFADAWLDL